MGAEFFAAGDPKHHGYRKCTWCGTQRRKDDLNGFDEWEKPECKDRVWCAREMTKDDERISRGPDSSKKP